MTWLKNLLQTYENNVNSIGQFERKRNGQEYALIPVSHTTQTAHVEVHISVEGDFLWAKVVDRDDANTIIPCTEKSANRTSSPEPHPLFDKLMYVAGDYARYCRLPRGTPHEDYLRQLLAWCESPDAHPKIRSVYTYLVHGTLMADLVWEKILQVDDHDRLIDKWTLSEEKPPIFRVLVGTQESAFIRFAVDVPGEPESRLWRDASVQESFIRYYERKLTDLDLCYISGEVHPYAGMHASRIRNSGDKAKLISANDTNGFTFRGRFQSSRDAVALSYGVSQKAHNALKWLIDRQGSVTIDGKVFLVWGTQLLDIPDPFGDSLDLYHTNEDTKGATGDKTHREFARQIRKALNGYRYDSTYASRVIVMVLDSATPGRMSIVYYRDLDQGPFLDRLQDWHESCCWLHHYRKDEENHSVSFLGAPATKDIAFAAYGPRVGDKIVKVLLERMLPCIVDGQPIPSDIVRSCVHRASNPAGMESWEWEKTLSITCALVNKTYQSEGFDVALDERIESRDYLFGRLLAIADVLERSAIEEKRASNAIRYMNAFSRYPARTWRIIQANIQPYQAKLGPRATYYNQLLDKVGSMLKPSDFTDQPLGGIYLLGFYSQRYDLYAGRRQRVALSEGAAQMTSNDMEEM